MTWSTCASWSYKCGCLKCVACHHKTWRDAEEIVFVLWRFRDSHWVWLFFSKLLPEALYASILNSMRREGKGLSFHRRSSFDHPLVSRKTAKKKFGSLYYNDAGRILWIACNGDFWPKFCHDSVLAGNEVLPDSVARWPSYHVLYTCFRCKLSPHSESIKSRCV